MKTLTGKNPPIPKKFDPKTAEEIRTLHRHAGCSYYTLAYLFKASKATIEHVCRGKGAYAKPKL